MTQLHQGWQFKKRNKTSPLETEWASGDWQSAIVPGTVHQDLLAHGQIPDPFYGTNEEQVQWIGSEDWLYRLEFEVEAKTLELHNELCFDGLDTFATVWLNGEQILQTDNMFMPHRAAVAQVLRAGKNELRILFESALLRGRELEQKYGPVVHWNGDTSRVFVRKAQYHYGWDWGPVLMTAGVWRAVRLESYSARVSDLHAPALIAEDLQTARIPVRAVLEGNLEGATIELELLDPSGETCATASGPASFVFERELNLEHPQLWWPNGYGEQPLYRLEVRVKRGVNVLHSQSVRLGMRRVRLLQDSFKAEPGSSFTFEINNEPIFVGGANWIPDDNFLPRISKAQYRLSVEAAKAMNMTMLRIWGGGIYEDDAFYEACDELGILVWQDFMFACAIYPTYPEFLESVQREADANVRRLRHHPSIALWCGNNEDYMLADFRHINDPGFQGNFLNTGFASREIYERRLPEAVARLDGTRPYWPGSPYSKHAPSLDQTTGDRHTWDIWHGEVRPYQEYPKYEGRFVSEFGMQAAPSFETIRASMPEAEQIPFSRTFDFHNKATDGPRRLAMYLVDVIGYVPSQLEPYVYATQLLQSEALKAAYGGWRRRFQGPGQYHVSGALVWQINDCWPVTSWALIDSNNHWKPACYTIKREIAQISVGLTAQSDGASIWAFNDTRQAFEATLELRCHNMAGQELATQTRTVRLEPRRANELGAWAQKYDEPTVISARLLRGDEVLARNTLWTEPFKHYMLPDPGFELIRVDAEHLRLSVKQPCKGLWLWGGPDAIWEDNMLDLVPGDDRVIHVSQLGTNPVTAYSLNDLMQRR
jgi:beta-mannosidase